jgi:rod shape-determining protein MreD
MRSIKADFVQAALGLGLAFGVYTILGRTASALIPLFSVFTLTVIWFGQKKGELFGAVMGTCSGLLLDAFSLGVFGISGLTLTVTGYLAGFIARKINVLSFLKTFIFLAALTVGESLLWVGIVSLFLSQKAGRLENILLLRPLVTAAVGAIVFAVLRKRGAQRG